VRTGVPYELETGDRARRREQRVDAGARRAGTGRQRRHHGLRGIAQDISERKQTEAARQESEAAFRTLADSVPQMIWMCTPDGLNVYFNQRWVDYTGMSLAESYGRGWNTPFHPDDQQPAWEAWNRATETGETYRVESRLRAADGSYRWFLMRGHAPARCRRTHRQVVRHLHRYRRFEARRRDSPQGHEELEERVEERTAQLRESEQRLALALRASHEGVWDWNVETGAVWYSSRCKEMLGYQESEIEPHASVFEKLLHPDDRVRFHDTVRPSCAGNANTR